MCGRFTLLADEIEILREFDVDGPLEEYNYRYNIAPGQDVFAIIHDGKKKRAGHLKWGLVPFWANDPKIGYKMINARSETAHEKTSFKHLLARKRCLIVADSFYEWKKDAKGKVPKRIALKNRPLFAFAGLWDKWQQEDKELFTCTILTQQANDFMAPIHERMPVILPKEKEREWIAPVKKDPTEMQALLSSIRMEALTAYDVSDVVNSAKNEGPECIAPLV